MNVLVYNDHDVQSKGTKKIGPGVSKRSYDDTVATLEALLKPYYVVQKVTPMELEEHPWQTSCALLVFPGGRDIPYLERLKNAAPRIAKWVREGGAYLGFCAGAYFACSHIEWEVDTPLQVKGPRPLKFFPGLSVGSTFPGFQYDSEQGAKAITIADERDGSQKRYIYHNGGGEFVLSGQESDVKVLARYTGEAQGKVAAVYCTVGKGRAVLWYPHIEFSITSGPAEGACKKLEQPPSEAGIKEAESDRLRLLRETLDLLGLNPTPPQNGLLKEAPHAPIPQLLCLSPLASPITEAYNAILSDNITNTAAFDFPPVDEARALIDQARSESHEEGLSKKPRIIKFSSERSLPPDLTPLFNTNEYFTILAQAYAEQTSSSPKETWRLGEVLLYGEAVTSTQTLLNEYVSAIAFHSFEPDDRFESNLDLRAALPVPLISLATFQLSGRGRGQNQWASPFGCLQFSLLIAIPNAVTAKAPWVQYLFSVAVVHACRNILPLSVAESVVIKWPNDIYAQVKNENGEVVLLKKIGGILVNLCYDGRDNFAIIGMLQPFYCLPVLT